MGGAECLKLMNVLRCAIIFQGVQYHYAKLFQLFQRTLQPTTAQQPKPTNTLTKANIYNKKYKIKI